MHFTRHILKEFIRNNELEASTICNPDFLGSHTLSYGRDEDAMRLRILTMRFPDYSERAFHIYDREINDWYKDVREMQRTFSFDDRKLKRLHACLYQSSPWIEFEHDRVKKNADIRKLNWVFDKMKVTPLNLNR